MIYSALESDAMIFIASVANCCKLSISEVTEFIIFCMSEVCCRSFPDGIKVVGICAFSCQLLSFSSLWLTPSGCHLSSVPISKPAAFLGLHPLSPSSQEAVASGILTLRLSDHHSCLLLLGKDSLIGLRPPEMVPY